MNDCTVCKLLKDEEPSRILFIGQYWQVALSADQEYLGRVYVTLKRHKEALSDLSDPELVELFDIIRKFEEAVKLAFKPTHFNWSCLMNNAVRDSESTHVHWHAIPRYKSTHVISGTTFKDSRWPETSRSVSPNIVSKEIITLIRDKLKNQFLLQS